MPAPGPLRAPRPRRVRGMAGLAVLLLGTAAIPPGPPAALAQGAPVGTPGGPEVETPLGPEPSPLLPEPGIVATPGPEILEPDEAPGPETEAVAADPVAEPEIGPEGDPLDGAEDLDPAAAVPDPLGLDEAPGRIDAGFALPPRRGRPGRPDDERGAGGLTLSFGLDLGLRASDNRRLRPSGGEGELRLVTGVSAGLLSRTQRQRLALDLDAEAVASSDPDDGDDGIEVERPRLAFAYEREGARARLGGALRLRRVDLDEARLLDLDDPFDGLPEADDLVVSGGTRTDLDAELEFAAGLDRPLGLELELRADARRYDGVGARSDLTDRDILGADVALRLDLARRLTTRLAFGASELDDDSGEERSTRSAGATAVYEATPTLRLTAALGRAEVESLRFRGTGEDLDGDGEEDRVLRARASDGIEASFGVVRELPRGRISAEIETEIEEGGRRDTLRVARAIALRGGVDLSASVGLSREEGEDPVVVGDLAYTQELARGRLRASLRRRAGASSDGDQVSATSASLGVLRELGRSSRLTLDLDFERLEGDDEESQSELRLAYVRSLTPDWSLSAGYEFERRLVEDDEATANTLFLTLGRDVLLRP